MQQMIVSPLLVEMKNTIPSAAVRAFSSLNSVTIDSKFESKEKLADALRDMHVGFKTKEFKTEYSNLKCVRYVCKVDKDCSFLVMARKGDPNASTSMWCIRKAICAHTCNTVHYEKVQSHLIIV